MPQDVSLRTLLDQALQKIATVFNLKTAELDLSNPTTLDRILQTVFDTDTRAFLSGQASAIQDRLSSTQKDRILAKGIAAIVVIFQRLAKTGRTVTFGLLNREAQLFAESDQHSLVLDKIGRSQMFNHCYHKGQISELITSAMAPQDKADVPDLSALDDMPDLTRTATAACDRPENMGLPWGFTIMALN